jgi:hypothetical protein
MNKVKIYMYSEIKKVYERHSLYPTTIMYSEDGYTWKQAPMDSGKWNYHDWMFAFLELDNKQ